MHHCFIPLRQGKVRLISVANAPPVGMDEYADVEMTFTFAAVKARNAPQRPRVSSGVLTGAMAPQRAFGLQVADARLRARLSQKQLAQRIHVKLRVIQEIELGAAVHDECKQALQRELSLQP
jgi:ribosome-binding protein aMBF1 (putative translation factor)